MIVEELATLIMQTFGFVPTADQAKATAVFSRFLLDRDGSSVMIMRGSAGTGKTSLAAAIVKTLVKLRQRVILLAPTGRPPRCFRSMPGVRPSPYIVAYTVRRPLRASRRASVLTTTCITTLSSLSTRRR